MTAAERFWAKVGLIRYGECWKVEEGLKNGTLIRPDTCASCGRECQPQAHHDDYDRPLDIVWLCGRCHKRYHAGLIPLPAGGGTGQDTE